MAEAEMMGMFACKDEEPEELECAGTNPTEMAPSQEVDFEVIGGTGPMSWAIAGNAGFTLKYPAATGRENKVITSAGVCGRCWVTVTDDESEQCVCYIVCTVGTWGINNSGSCGGCNGGSSGPQHIPIDHWRRWEYCTSPEGTGFCTGNHGICGYLDCGPLEDGYGKVGGYK